jgi:hypothetical protein
VALFVSTPRRLAFDGNSILALQNKPHDELTAPGADFSASRQLAP